MNEIENSENINIETEKLRKQNQTKTAGLVILSIALLVLFFLNSSKKEKIYQLEKRLEDEPVEENRKELRNEIKTIVQSEKKSYNENISSRIDALLKLCEDAPDFVNELNQIMPSLEAGLFSKAFFAIAKILENLIGELYELRKQEFSNTLEFIENSGQFSKEEIKNLLEIKKLRNSEAHVLGINNSLPEEKFIEHILFSLEISLKLKKELASSS